MKKIVVELVVSYCTLKTGGGGKVTQNQGSFKVPITSMGILNICNFWILLRKIVMYLVGRKCWTKTETTVSRDQIKENRSLRPWG